MPMLSNGDIIEIFPEIERIKDPKMKAHVIRAWQGAMEMSECDDLRTVLWTLAVPGLTATLVEHTRKVTRMAEAVARERGDLDVDLVIAGALLHDIGKVLEYAQVDGRTVKSETGKGLRHPVSGAGLAMKFGLPYELVHIIANHSKEGDFVARTPEAILIHHVDFVDFDIAKARLAAGK
jgi:putative nucleotidyltransferase with HDIG domain